MTKPRSSSCRSPSSISRALLAMVVLLLCCCSVARSQTTTTTTPTDSCTGATTGLAAVSRLIPFDTSNLTCFDAWSSQGFIMRFGRTNDTWSFVLSAPDGGSYISVGFSPDGKMEESNAVAGWRTTTGGNGSEAGVAKRYWLGGMTPASCPPDQGSLALVRGTPLLVAHASRLYLAFQFTAAEPPAPYLIYAVGPPGARISNDGYLVVHRHAASVAFDYATGVDASSGARGASSSSTPSPGTRKLHGAMAGLGWGVLMPVGVALARYLRHRDPLWFYAHVAVQGVGFVLGAVGAVAGFKLEGDRVAGADRHEALGVAIAFFGFLQVLALLLRPDQGSKARLYWNWYHHYVGRAAVVCAIANVFVGLSVAHDAAALSAVYGVFVAVLVLTSAVLEVRLWRSARSDSCVGV